jgi:hypothetical protein
MWDRGLVAGRPAFGFVPDTRRPSLGTRDGHRHEFRLDRDALANLFEVRPIDEGFPDVFAKWVESKKK